MFKRLFSRVSRLNLSVQDKEAFRRSVAIDVSGPEFVDRYPTREAWSTTVSGLSSIRPEEREWIADALFSSISEGSGWEAALLRVTRNGDQASADMLEAFGFTSRKKIGRRFLLSLSTDAAKAAIDELERAIHTICSNQMHLHNLRRYGEAAITHVRFSSAKDERCTELEKQLEGKRMTIAEAVDLVKTHGSEIVRSTFMAEVKF